MSVYENLLILSLRGSEAAVAIFFKRLLRFARNDTGQSTIEFTFAMIATMFLIYGLVVVLRWGGMDLASRRVAQDSALTRQVLSTDLYPSSTPGYLDEPNGDPSVQLNSDVGGSVLPIAAVYHGSITNGNETP